MRMGDGGNLPAVPNFPEHGFQSYFPALVKGPNLLVKSLHHEPGFGR